MCLSSVARMSFRMEPAPIRFVDPRMLDTPTNRSTPATKDPSLCRLVNAAVERCFPANAGITIESCHTQ